MGDRKDNDYKEVFDELKSGKKVPKSIVGMYHGFSLDDDFITFVESIGYYWHLIGEETKDNVRQVFDNAQLTARAIMRDFLSRCNHYGIDPRTEILEYQMQEISFSPADWAIALDEIIHLLVRTISYALTLMNCELIRNCNGNVDDCNFIIFNRLYEDARDLSDELVDFLMIEYNL